MLKPISQMPASLRSHTRYPEDLFRIQRSVYSTFHIDDPRVLYSKSDIWAIPTEPNALPQKAVTNADGTITPSNQQMDPYFVVMKMPKGVSSEDSKTLKDEFLLMSPLAPIKREGQNILGWMCARCDGEHYGELVLYRFPQQASVNGPSQVIAFVNNDPVISPQLTPLRLAGSTANFGNLLVIPVEKSLLYIAPLYVESTTGATGLPKLEKVVVAYGDRVVMEDSLPKALADLFPTDAKSDAETTSKTETSTLPANGDKRNQPVSESVRNLILKATAEYSRAQQKLKAGDFAGYGASMKDVERELNSLKQAAGVK